MRWEGAGETRCKEVTWTCGRPDIENRRAHARASAHASCWYWRWAGVWGGGSVWREARPSIPVRLQYDLVDWARGTDLVPYGITTPIWRVFF